MSEKFEATMTYLRRICSGREYCTRDIVQKAGKRLEDEAEVTKAVETLREEGFLSDERYAAAFARDKSTITGWGPAKIRFTLASKGISREAISTALESIDSEKADAKLRKSLEIKHKQLSGDPQIRLKLLKFALSRGYSYDDANRVVSDLLLN